MPGCAPSNATTPDHDIQTLFAAWFYLHESPIHGISNEVNDITADEMWRIENEIGLLPASGPLDGLAKIVLTTSNGDDPFGNRYNTIDTDQLFAEARAELMADDDAGGPVMIIMRAWLALERIDRAALPPEAALDVWLTMKGLADQIVGMPVTCPRDVVAKWAALAAFGVNADDADLAKNHDLWAETRHALGMAA
ncbi:hypothetical protein PE067_10250 [Paracoccus sp. DMF-8]|uniref:hypothetical protein n=1 Tax=Paracoccus sp. DMF-8 TaxID=3019445 RepID=UPI0023E8D7A1|nr:hypothetical protein [Paracoccus sp. DMF-8]MDF3606490.1 hypothetical protein [Paracoccus sp. DMF-8]